MTVPVDTVRPPVAPLAVIMPVAPAIRMLVAVPLPEVISPLLSTVDPRMLVLFTAAAYKLLTSTVAGRAGP